MAGNDSCHRPAYQLVKSYPELFWSESQDELRHCTPTAANLHFFYISNGDFK